MSAYEGFIIPSNPADQIRLSQMMNEVVNSITRSKSEAEHKKEVIANISEEFAIPKSAISAAAKIMYHENLNEVKSKQEDLEQLVTVITQARSRTRIQKVADSADDTVEEQDSDE